MLAMYKSSRVVDDTRSYAVQVMVWVDGSVQGSAGPVDGIDTWATSGPGSFARAAHDGKTPAGEPNSDWPGGEQTILSDLLAYVPIDSTATCEGTPHLLGEWSLPKQDNLEVVCCSPCPIGSILSAQRCQCDAGYTGLGLSRRRLLATSSSTGGEGASSSTAIPTSTTPAVSQMPRTSSGSMAMTSSSGTSSATLLTTPTPSLYPCMACGMGKYKNLTGPAECVDCPQGSYSSRIAATSATECLLCPAFSWSPDGAVNVKNCTCPVGYTGPDGGVCDACDTGKFKNVNGTGSCQMCIMGLYSDLPGQTACRECPAGSMSVAGSASCTFNVVDLKVSSSIDANLTTFRRLQGRIMEAYAVVIGVQQSAVKLISAREAPKELGFFRRLFASANVTNITVIDVLVTIPKVSVADSVHRLEQNLTVYLRENGLPVVELKTITQTCGAGAQPDPVSTQCVPCRRGSYKFKSDNSSCLPCVTNSSTAEEGALLVEHCVCNAGYYSSEKLDENVSCSECGLGYFCTGNQSRSPCPVGTYGSASTLPMRSSCRLCPVRTSSFLASFRKDNCSCDKGYTGSAGPNFTACVACDVGFYKPVVGDNIDCTPCAEGKYQGAVASRSDNCSACPANSWSPEGSPLNWNCTCEAGHTGLNGMPCVACSAGTYKQSNGSAPCEDCGAGTYSLQAATGCELCPGNTFSGVVAAPSPDTCESCPDFSTSPVKSVAFENCTCIPGTYPQGVQCIPCRKCSQEKSIYRFNRAACLPCSGQENHEKYAGQGQLEEFTCQGSDVKYWCVP